VPSGASARRKIWGEHTCEGSAYNGGLAPSHQRSPWAEPIVRGSRESPLGLKIFQLLNAQRKLQIRLSHRSLQTGETISKPHIVKSHRICINLGNILWQKSGGYVHPSPPRDDAPVWMVGGAGEKILSPRSSVSCDRPAGCSMSRRALSKKVIFMRLSSDQTGTTHGYTLRHACNPQNWICQSTRRRND